MDTCPKSSYAVTRITSMLKEITDLQEADALWDLGLIYYVYDSNEDPVPDDDWTLDDSAMRKKGDLRAAYKPTRWYPEKHRYAIRLED